MPHPSATPMSFPCCNNGHVDREARVPIAVVCWARTRCGSVCHTPVLTWRVPALCAARMCGRCCSVLARRVKHRRGLAWNPSRPSHLTCMAHHGWPGSLPLYPCQNKKYSLVHDFFIHSMRRTTPPPHNTYQYTLVPALQVARGCGRPCSDQHGSWLVPTIGA